VIVVDASVGVAYLTQANDQPELNSLLLSSGKIIVPSLFDYEVGSALRRLCFAGVVDEHRVANALETLIALPFERQEPKQHLLRMWHLRNNISFYDASYVVLAEFHAVPLYTLDLKLAKSSGHRVQIRAP
jgi:predicted nucleic acid-binding protein